MSTDTQNLTNGDNANNGNLLLVDIEDELRRSYLGYAVSTLVSRALPDVRDGFKPVARRILYAMRELGLSPTSRHVKCAAVVGETMKRFHPHGDQAIYDTLVRMAQPFSLRYPLVDGQGNFGCFTGDTRIKLLDGTEKSFAELAERPADEVFHVYSVDKQGRIVVGEGRNARITRRKARLVEVTLDNGKKIRCTPDHRFMLRDGAYKEAQHLTGEDSLMPGYFDTAPVKERLNDYLRILQPAALVSAGQNNNHRAVSVRWLGDCEDVYDITVDEHHNFLLASGVFVHNSVDGDPAAAMRYCVAGDTYIVTGAGLRRIDSLSDGAEDIQTKVLSIGGKVNTASKWFDCGEHPTRRLRTRRGYEVTGTLNHPLLVCSPDGSKCPRLVWKLVSQIQPGDYLVLDRSEALWPEQPVDLRPYHPEIPAGSRTQRHELPDHLTDDFAFLLGALVAEGTFMSDKIEFTNVPGDFADAFQQTWKNVFPTCRLHTFMRQPVSYGKRPFWQMQIVSHQMRAFFGNLGLKGHSAERQIPDAILRSPQPVAAAFLRGLFEGDGAVERSGRSLLRVSLCSRNEAFMKQVQTLLLRFGIVCARSREEQRRMHRLCITGRDNLQRFADRIGFVSQNKQQALSEVLQIHSGRSLTKTDFVPFLADYVRGKATRHREWLDRHNFDRSARLPEALPRLAQALPPADVEQIEFLARTHYLFDEVVSVEDAGEQRVYSVRVDSECHSFVANGFVNHNTEARLTALATEMMEDIDRDTVDWMPTYDQSDNEPLVLPGRFPNFLCNGGEGIAVGMTTKVPPHNLREVCDACIWMLEKPDATVAELMKFIQGPDFPTAGIILGTKGIKEAYETGRGRVIVQANMQIEPMEGGKNAIVITELPYQVNKQRLIENIAELHKQKKVDGITSILDLTDRHGMRVVIELRRDAYPRKVLNFLLKHTALRTTFGVIMLALVDQQPRLLTLPAAIGHYLKHRREMIVRRTRYELGRAKQRAHILEGLQIALDVMDEIIRIIRAAEDDSIARTEMMARFGFTQIQAEAILSMQLRQLTRLNRNRLEEEYKGKLKEVAGYEDILVNPARVTAIVKGELKTLKDKYGDERRTRIIPTEAEEIGEEDLIPEEDMLVTITRDGYVKRVPMDTYRTQKRGGRGIIGANTKEEDTIEHLFVANTHDYILFFTNRGRVYKLKAYEVPQTSRQAMGTAVVNLINIEPGDVVTATVPVKDLHSAEGFMFFTTQNGEVKRVDLKDFANLRANGLICFDLEPDDELKWVKLTDGNQECILITHGGKSIRFKEGDVPSRGRPAGGVRGIEMRDAGGKLKDRVVAMDVVRATSQLLVVGERGIGKRTNLADYRAQSRGGKGIITMDITEKTGNIVDAVVVEPDDKLMIITKNGITIRMEVAGIRAAGRSTQGVKLINLEPGDSVATIERLARSEDVEETGKVTHAAPDASGKV